MAISITDPVRAYQCYTECITKFYNTEPPPPGCVDSNGKVIIVACPGSFLRNCYPQGCEYWNARRLAEINRCKKQCGIEDILKPINLVNGATPVTSLQIETARYKSEFEKSTVIAIDRVGPPRRRYPKPIPEQCKDINDCYQRATDWYKNTPDRIRYDKCLAASKAWLDCMTGCKGDPECAKGCSDARDRTSPSRDECSKLIKIVMALLDEYKQLLLDCEAVFHRPGGGGGGVVCIVSYPYARYQQDEDIDSRTR